MKKFEYMQFAPKMEKGFLSKSFDANLLSKQLNELGAEGWELVSTFSISGNAGIASYGAATVGVVFIFKREII